MVHALILITQCSSVLHRQSDSLMPRLFQANKNLCEGLRTNEARYLPFDRPDASNGLCGEGLLVVAVPVPLGEVQGSTDPTKPACAEHSGRRERRNGRLIGHTTALMKRLQV